MELKGLHGRIADAEESALEEMRAFNEACERLEVEGLRDFPVPRPTLVVANAFSLNMLDAKEAGLRFVPLTLEQAQAEWPGCNVISVVGHADTARVFSVLLGTEIEYNRCTYKRREDDILLVGQYSGPRLPEGATELPEGAAVQWWLVEAQP